MKQIPSGPRRRVISAPMQQTRRTPVFVRVDANKPLEIEMTALARIHGKPTLRQRLQAAGLMDPLHD